MAKYYLGTAGTLALLCLFGGCASLPPSAKRDPNDPFERVNRSMYQFNVAADRAIFQPAGRAWQAVVPRPVRRGLNNFVGNLEYPVTIVNDLLQGKLRDTGTDVTRLLINTVFGLGFFDPATQAGLERHNEDFGQTLGKWGVPTGPYLMLPFLGPSTMRDAPAKLVDQYSTGLYYIKNNYLRYGLWTTDKLELRANLLDADAVLQRTFDPYGFVRNAWLERREYQVRDGNVEPDAADTGADAPSDMPADVPADVPANTPAKTPITTPIR